MENNITTPVNIIDRIRRFLNPPMSLTDFAWRVGYNDGLYTNCGTHLSPFYYEVEPTKSAMNLAHLQGWTAGKDTAERCVRDGKNPLSMRVKIPNDSKGYPYVAR